MQVQNTGFCAGICLELSSTTVEEKWFNYVYVVELYLSLAMNFASYMFCTINQKMLYIFKMYCTWCITTKIKEININCILNLKKIYFDNFTFIINSSFCLKMFGKYNLD